MAKCSFKDIIRHREQCEKGELIPAITEVRWGKPVATVEAFREIFEDDPTETTAATKSIEAGSSTTAEAKAETNSQLMLDLDKLQLVLDCAIKCCEMQLVDILCMSFGEDEAQFTEEEFGYFYYGESKMLKFDYQHLLTFLRDLYSKPAAEIHAYMNNE